MEALGAQLSALAEKRRDEDPALLRARIAELEGMLAAGAGSVGVAEKVVEVERRVEVPVPLGEDLVRLEGLVGRIEALRESLGDAAGSLMEALRPALAQLPAPAVAEPIPMAAPTRVDTPPATGTPPHTRDGGTTRETSPRGRPPTRGAAAIRSAAPADRRQPEPEEVAAAERAALATLARHPEGRSRAQLALIAGYAPADPALAKALTYLRTEGHLEGTGELLTLTPSGREAAGEPEPLPTGRALVELWERSLPTAQKRLLQAALEAYPGSASRAQLGRAAGYKVGAGAFNAALQRLRALGLVGEAEGGLRASPAFFGE